MRFRLVSKLDLAVIAAFIGGAVLWIEYEHRVFIDAPAPAESAVLAPAAACPDNDNVPYSASCLAFMGRAYVSGMSWQMNAAENPTAPPGTARQ
jgi:hypothetical protein